MEEDLSPSLFAEHTSLESLLYYLYKHESPGVQAYLINKLFAVPIEKISEFLLQLASLSLKREDYGAYEIYFRRSIEDSMPFGLRLLWVMKSFAEDPPSKFQDRLASMVEVLMEAPYNSSTPFYNIHPSVATLSMRRKYIDFQTKFALTLGKIGKFVPSVPAVVKDITLQCYLRNLDIWLKNNRVKHQDKKYFDPVKQIFRGVILPLGTQEQIVSIVSEECRSLGNPYKLVVETIDLSEIRDLCEEPTTLDCDPIEIGETDEALPDKYASIQEFVDNLEDDEIQVTPETETETSWEETCERLKQFSLFSHFSSHKYQVLLIKPCKCIRQEILALQFIKTCKSIFEEGSLTIFLKIYEIVLISKGVGVVEYLPNVKNIDQVKRTGKSLYEYFCDTFSDSFEEAQKNFVESMAGYSLVCYLLNLKDRNNQNILIDNQGHIIHVDFSYYLSNNPGGNVEIETAPFKLTREMVDIMGGYNSEMFLYYKVLMIKGFFALRKKCSELCLIFDTMKPGEGFPCFATRSKAISSLRNRFHLKYSDEQCLKLVEDLVNEAAENKDTVKYDRFQRKTFGINT